MAELARELAELTLELADELDEPRLVHTTHAIHGRTGLARAARGVRHSPRKFGGYT